MNEVVINIRSSGSKDQLIMFPFAGGHGRSYIEFVKHFKMDFEVIGINPPGSYTSGSERINSVSELMKIYVKAIVPVMKDNIIIYGHSMGGIIAYEFLRNLPDYLIKKIKHVILTGAYPPDKIKNPDCDDLNSKMSDGEIVERCISLGGFPVQLKVDKEFCRLFCRMIRNDLETLESYRLPENVNKLGLSTTVCWGAEEKMNREGAEKWNLFLNVKKYYEFEGDHFFIFGKNLSDMCSIIEESFRS